jgi:ABC-type glycerol-3-phosphate transport system substrate-binding protein
LLHGGAAALALVAVAPVLAACNQAPATPTAAPAAAGAPAASAPAKLEVWLINSFAPAGDDEQKRQMEEWAKSKGNVTIDVLLDGYDNQVKRETVAVAGQAYPDIMDVEDQVYRQFSESGAYVDVTGLYDEIGKRFDKGWLAVTDKIAAISKKQNKKLIIPYTNDTQVMMYRADVAAQKKLPEWTTWEELFQISAQAADPPGLYGCGIQLSLCGDAETWLQTIIAYGGKMTDETGEKITIVSPETKEALALIKKSYEDKSLNKYPPGIFQWDNASDNTAWQEHHIYMIANPPSVLVWMRNNDKDLLSKTKSTKSPFASKDKKIPNDYTGLNNGLTVANSGQQQTVDLAQDLISYIMQPANYEKMIGLHMMLPTVDSTGLSKLSRWSDPNDGAMYELNKTAIWSGWPAELSPQYGEFLVPYPTAFMVTRMVQQNWSVDQALDEYYQRAKTIWEKHNFKQ